MRINTEPLSPASCPDVRCQSLNQAVDCLPFEALDMSTSIELTEVPTRIRRHSFSEAIEAGKEFPESYAGPEEKEVGASSIDDKAQTTAATTTTTSVSYKSSAMGTVSDVLQSYGIFIGIVVLVVAAIAALLVVILVPLSFADLDYYQVGC